jgi:hypothetical protein
MRTHFALTKAQQRADWMARFSDLLVTANPAHSGRIDWDTAAYHYLGGKTPEQAAELYLRRGAPA